MKPFPNPTEILVQEHKTSGYWDDLMAFANSKPTPFLLVSTDNIRGRYRELKQSFGQRTKIFYAVKANPKPEVLQALASEGSSFDVASTFELDALLDIGINPSRMSYGNPIKKAADIEHAYKKGVRLFACDGDEDLANLAAHAPSSNILFRLATKSDATPWSSARKFGASPGAIRRLVLKAKQGKLVPYGLTFHVGNQKCSPRYWKEPIKEAARLFRQARNDGVALRALNLGGGFAAKYLEGKAPNISDYGQKIQQSLRDHFERQPDHVWVEPGRTLVSDSGVVVSEVVLAKKSRGVSWLYLDVGVFGGLMESMSDGIQYPVFAEGQQPFANYVLAGPTCDNNDVLNKGRPYRLPRGLGPGHRLYLLSTGAYTQSYSSSQFNGFPPLRSYAI